MKGAVIGDVVGSAYEFNNIATKEFPLFSWQSTFTDDTVMSCAVAKALTDCRGNYDTLTEDKIAATLQEVGRRYPNCGYGRRFIQWMFSDNPQPYNSCGNGSAMRVSAVGFLAENEVEVKLLSERITAVTHNHPEGLKGAECTAMCIFLARQGKSKEELRNYVEDYYYHLCKTCEDYRIEQAGHHGKEICQISVPQALECFFESIDFEDCIRNCISIGGDSDTIAAIAGGIAEAYYGIPEDLWQVCRRFLPADLDKIITDFEAELLNR